MILRPVRPASPSGPADNELARRVDVPVAIVVDGQIAERLADVRLDHLADLVRIPVVVEVLGRQDDLGDRRRLAVFVTNRDLALAVGAEFGGIALSTLAGIGQETQNLVRVVDGCRHEVRGLVDGVSEHDALVAGSLVALLVGGAVDALGNVGGLGVQQHFDLGVLPVEAVLLVADVADGAAGGRTEAGRIDHVLAVLVLLHQGGRNPYLAGDHDAVGGGQGFGSNAHAPRIDACLARFLVDQIDDLVGNAITHFVGMSLRHRLAGEMINVSRHGPPLRNQSDAALLLKSGPENKRRTI